MGLVLDRPNGPKARGCGKPKAGGPAWAKAGGPTQAKAGRPNRPRWTSLTGPTWMGLACPTWVGLAGYTYGYLLYKISVMNSYERYENHVIRIMLYENSVVELCYT